MKPAGDGQLPALFTVRSLRDAEVDALTPYQQRPGLDALTVDVAVRLDIVGLWQWLVDLGKPTQDKPTCPICELYGRECKA